MQPYIICDLDGTLCNIEHRLHYTEGEHKNWQAFFEGIPEDVPNEQVSFVLQQCALPVVLISGRPQKYKELDCEALTIAWLKKYGFEKYELVMREADDRRDDDIIKKELYQTKIEPKYGKPLLVLDDRDRVVKMWRDLGLVCFQVAPGNF